MKYQRKFQECLYRTSDGKCTHKHIKKRVSKRKRRCGYSKPRECEMYLEWDELRNYEDYGESSILPPLKRKFKWYKKR